MSELKRTQLFDIHVEAGATMVDFGGWEMPVQYPTGIVAEHLYTRSNCSLFDVSHMGRLLIEGPERVNFLQYVLSSNVLALELNTAQYCIIPDENGYAIDDAYLYMFEEDNFLLVVNAANTEKDLAHLLPIAEKFDVKITDITPDWAAIAVQGPQSRKMLLEGKKLGLRARIHADEIEEIGGASLSGEVEAISAEHLIATGETGMAAMAKGGVIADLLPATSFYLNKTFAPARRMIELGIPVAIASDFNPGSCPSLNLQLAMSMGYIKYRMTPEEVLTAVTINAACSVGMEDKIGTREEGKQADIVIWDAPDMEMLVYRFGSNLAKTVIKNGEVVKA